MWTGLPLYVWSVSPVMLAITSVLPLLDFLGSCRGIVIVMIFFFSSTLTILFSSGVLIGSNNSLISTI